MKEKVGPSYTLCEKRKRTNLKKRKSQNLSTKPFYVLRLNYR